MWLVISALRTLEGLSSHGESFRAISIPKVNKSEIYWIETQIQSWTTTLCGVSAPWKPLYSGHNGPLSLGYRTSITRAHHGQVGRFSQRLHPLTVVPMVKSPAMGKDPAHSGCSHCHKGVWRGILEPIGVPLDGRAHECIETDLTLLSRLDANLGLELASEDFLRWLDDLDLDLVTPDWIFLGE